MCVVDKHQVAAAAFADGVGGGEQVHRGYMWIK
mgnify:CR=1 FL=1